MSKKPFGTAVVDVDAEGYMTDFSQWTREIAAAIAAEEGLAELTPLHWKVIEFIHKEFRESGHVPSIRKLNKSGVINTRELYDIFPGGPAKKAAKIAGMRKPDGCV